MALIPDNAKVTASSPVVPHLAGRKFIYTVPDFYFADYILLVNEDSFLYPWSRAETLERIDDILRSSAWKCEYNKDRVYLFKRIK